MSAYVAIILRAPNEQAVLTSCVGEGDGLIIDLRHIGIDLEKVHTIGLSYAHEKPPDVLAELIARAEVMAMGPEYFTRIGAAPSNSVQAKKILKFLQDFQLEQSEKNITTWLVKSVTTDESR